MQHAVQPEQDRDRWNQGSLAPWQRPCLLQLGRQHSHQPLRLMRRRLLRPAVEQVCFGQVRRRPCLPLLLAGTRSCQELQKCIMQHSRQKRPHIAAALLHKVQPLRQVALCAVSASQGAPRTAVPPSAQHSAAASAAAAKSRLQLGRSAAGGVHAAAPLWGRPRRRQPCSAGCAATHWACIGGPSGLSLAWQRLRSCQSPAGNRKQPQSHYAITCDWPDG